MASAATIRLEVEAALAHRIPSALTVAPRASRPVACTGIVPVDDLVQGLPIGAITEIVGPECSGRTSFTLAFLARLTEAGKAVAWIDASNALAPESAAAAGIDLGRMLWVRCGVTRTCNSSLPTPADFALPKHYFVPSPIKQGLHGGGCGAHPRTAMHGVANALPGLFQTESAVKRNPQPTRPDLTSLPSHLPACNTFVKKFRSAPTPQTQLDQALRVADLLLQAGGFSAIVLDLADIAPELSSRVPLATWFRYRAASERTQTSFLLLTQHACAKSSAALVLHLEPAAVAASARTIFTGFEHQISVARQRFNQPTTNLIPMRKPPRSAACAPWQSRAVWAGCP